MPLFALRLLGGFDVRLVDGAPLALASKKAMALLAFLALSGRPVARERLAYLLWGDVSADAQARASLRQALSVLRKALPAGVLRTSRDHVELIMDRVEVDARSLEALAHERSRESLERVAALYQGELLEGISARADAFEDWLVPQRQRFRELAVDALSALLALQEQHGAIEAATTTALRLVSLDPLDEGAHAALMRMFATQGRTGDALRQYRMCREALERELGTPPGAAIERIRDDIRQGRIAPAPGRGSAAARALESEAPAARAVAPGPGPELRAVAVLFASLTPELLGPPEDPLDAGDGDHGRRVSQYRAIARAVVESHGGQVRKDMGDTLMAVFGVPRARGNDLEHAARATLAMQDRLRAHGLSAGIAVTIGQVLVTGAERARAIMGAPVSQAARLHLHAQAGEVLLSEAAGLSLSTRAAVSRVELTPRGKGAPIVAWHLDGLETEPRVQAPFVGREHEIAQLEAALEVLLRTRRGRAFVILGQAGIGKTRLLQRIADAARPRAIAVHRAAVLDFGTRRGRDAITSLLRSVLDLPAGELDGQVITRCAVDRGLLAASRGAALEELLGVPSPGSTAVHDHDSRDERERQCRAALRELISAASRRTPMVLVVEDVHWADMRTHQHLTALAELVASCPALLVTTSRPVEAAGYDRIWQRRLHGQPLTVIALGPLAPDEAMQLARSTWPMARDQAHPGAGDADASAERLRALVARAGGNPLFIEQLLLMAPTDTDIPGSVQSVMQARLDLLAAADREVLQAASVLGHELAWDLLARFLDRPALDIERLEVEGLLRHEGTELMFTHALLREAVYASIVPETRRELHCRAAELLVDEPVLHAQHLDRGGAAGAAAAYIEAARVEEGARRLDHALELCERGLELCERDDAAAGTGFELACARASLLRSIGQVEASAGAFRDALQRAPTSSARCRAWVGVAEALRVLDRYDDALDALRRAEGLADAEAEPQALSHIHYLRGSILFPRGDAEGCLRAHQRALELARRATCRPSEVRASSGIGDAYYLVGRMESARAWFERCLALCREHGLRWLELPNLPMRGHARVFQLEIRAAAEDCLAATRAAAELGDLRCELMACSAAFLPLFALGLHADAEVRARRALEIGKRIGSRRFESSTLCYVAAVHAARGEQEVAEDMLERAYRLSRRDSMDFTGKLVMGLMALVTREPAVRRRALAEGDALMEHDTRRGHTDHGGLVYLQYAIDASLAEGDLERTERYVALLERHMQMERFAWAELQRARGLALIRFHRGERSEALRAELGQLAAWARRVELLLVVPALERAISELHEPGAGSVPGEPGAGIRTPAST